MVFSLLWGVPYLVAGQGMSPTAASVLLTVLVGAGAVAGPLFGEFTARHPLRRSWLVLGVIAVTAAAWTAVLALPAPAPLWLLVLLVQYPIWALATVGVLVARVRARRTLAADGVVVPPLREVLARRRS